MHQLAFLAVILLIFYNVGNTIEVGLNEETKITIVLSFPYAGHAPVKLSFKLVPPSSYFPAKFYNTTVKPEELVLLPKQRTYVNLTIKIGSPIPDWRLIVYLDGQYYCEYSIKVRIGENRFSYMRIEAFSTALMVVYFIFGFFGKRIIWGWRR